MSGAPTPSGASAAPIPSGANAAPIPSGASAAPMSRVVQALEAAGLLVSASAGLPAAVTQVTEDSRAVVPGALFLAVRGAERDGHDYLAAAAAAGAAAVMVDDPSRASVPAIVVRDTRRAAAVAAAAFHDAPARALRLVGVTGTNGKTTTVGMLRHLLDAPGQRAASIGTLGVLVGSEGTELPGGSGLTTPGPVELQRVLRALVDAGVGTVAMETSSHALHQRRVEGLRFAAGIFTNLTRDHLDYHVTMEAYLAAKAMLVDALTDDGVSVVNADDDAWGALRAAPRTVRFGARDDSADVRAEEVRFTPRGSCWTLVCGTERHEVTLPLIGDFNISNALAGAAAAWALGMPGGEIAARLSSMPQVPGRLEMISEQPTVLRDYAHTPDALERALAAVRPFVTGRLIVVFGCGGDRDRGKRPEMGRIAQAHADLAIVTSDNPRTEDPERILDDVEAGMDGPHLRIEDRREAIARALALAQPGDVILLAGKGHETYQIRGTVKHPFDERTIVRELIAGRPT